MHESVCLAIPLPDLAALMVCLALMYANVWCSGETDGYRHVLNIISNAITIAFVAEAVVKVVGYGPWAYISDNWCALSAKTT